MSTTVDSTHEEVAQDLVTLAKFIQKESGGFVKLSSEGALATASHVITALHLRRLETRLRSLEKAVGK